jgi:hypothetical protein
MATNLQLWGAGSFGALIGWYVYYINRHRRDEVSATDLVTLLGVIGGTAVLKLFPEGTDLFGAYGLGLGIGFFGYFVIMWFMVIVSKNFDADYFLDGRRKKPTDPYYIPTREEEGKTSGGAMGTPAGGQGSNNHDGQSSNPPKP